MKANELMIGDWVYNPFTRKTTRLTFGRDLDIAEGICLEPILLTAEILEKNGFKKFNFEDIKGSHKWTWWCDMQTFVSLWCRELNDDTKEGWILRVESPFTSSLIKIEYVHELQHALRLCGIDKEIKLED